MFHFRYVRAGDLRLLGAPVFVNTSVFLATGIIAISALDNPFFALLALVSYLAIIALHETGHALMAKRIGNPAYRIDIGWLHGRCHYQAPYYEWDEVLISWGGVLMQLLVAIPILVADAFGLLDSLPLAGPTVVFLGYINLLFALINSAPSPGFDGAKMWRILPIIASRVRSRVTAKEAVRNIRKDR